MSEFDNYAGLFADQGDFDIPETWTVGAAVKITPKLTLLADYQHNALSDIPAVGNSVSRLFAGQPLGSSNGPGFGWEDVDVIKLGVIYQATPQLTLRAGYSDLDQPILPGETFFNILAPGVVEKHYTLGGERCGEREPHHQRLRGPHARGVGAGQQLDPARLSARRLWRRQCQPAYGRKLLRHRLAAQALSAVRHRTAT